jgi:nicotinate-nucleotide adenylyltransferase
MKIGLYFGSFNPIHHGHLIIANFFLYNTDLKQIWFIVSPQNPLKPSHGLLNEYQRLYLVQLAVEKEPRLKASDIEFRLPRPSYTIDTLTYLQEKYPSYDFTVIMGSDSLENLHRWKNYRQIIDHYELLVYTRPGHPAMEFKDNEKVTFMKAPLLEISATHIRDSVKNGKSIRFLVPDKVCDEIERNSYYRS